MVLLYCQSGEYKRVSKIYKKNVYMHNIENHTLFRRLSEYIFCVHYCLTNIPLVC